MKLALSGILFEDHYQTQSVTFEEFCYLAHDAGYDGVSLRRTQIHPWMPDYDRHQIKSLLSQAMLEVTSLTARGLPENLSERDTFFRAYLDLCSELGCRSLKISADPDWLHDAAQQAMNVGVRLLTNNHLHTPLQTIDGTMDHIDAVNHPNYGLMLDVMHLLINGQDVHEHMEALLPYVHDVLIRWVQMQGDSPDVPPLISYQGRDWFRSLPGESSAIDWALMFSILREQRFDRTVTVVESGWPCFQRSRIAYEAAMIVRLLWYQRECV